MTENNILDYLDLQITRISNLMHIKSFRDKQYVSEGILCINLPSFIEIVQAN